MVQCVKRVLARFEWKLRTSAIEGRRGKGKITETLTKFFCTFSSSFFWCEVIRFACAFVNTRFLQGVLRTVAHCSKAGTSDVGFWTVPDTVLREVRRLLPLADPKNFGIPLKRVVFSPAVIDLERSSEASWEVPVLVWMDDIG